MKLDDTQHKNLSAVLTHEEVAAIMTDRGFPMCRGRVWQIERAAFRKIAANAEVRELAEELGFLRSV